MFWATMCPSLGETIVFMRHLVVLVILYDWLVCTLRTRQSSIQSDDKYQVSHKYGCFSWWLAHSHPKPVEKRNKHTKKNCAPSWLYLQVCLQDCDTVCPYFTRWMWSFCGMMLVGEKWSPETESCPLPLWPSNFWRCTLNLLIMSMR